MEVMPPVALLPSINAGGKWGHGPRQTRGLGEYERALGRMIPSSFCLRLRRVGRETIGSRIRLRMLQRSWVYRACVSPLEEKLRLSALGEHGVCPTSCTV